MASVTSARAAAAQAVRASPLATNHKHAQRPFLTPSTGKRGGRAGVGRVSMTQRHLVVASAGRKTVSVVTNVQPSTSSANPKERVPVTFELTHGCGFGDIVKVVGNAPELGGWVVENSLTLTWTKGNVWTATTNLVASGKYEFKAVVVQAGGNVFWQPTQGNCSFDLSELSGKNFAAATVTFAGWDNKAVELTVPIKATKAPVQAPVKDIAADVSPVVTEAAPPAVPEPPAPPASEVEKEAEKKPTAKAAPIAPPPVKPKKEELPKPAVPKAEPKPVPKSVADPKVEKKAVPTEEEDKQEDSTITAEMGGTMVLKREASEDDKAEDKSGLVGVFVALGLAGLFAGGGAIFFALEGKTLLDVADIPSIHLPTLEKTTATTRSFFNTP